MEPIYPKTEIEQTELRERLLIGVVGQNGNTWFEGVLDTANDSAAFQYPGDAQKALLESAQYEAVIVQGYAVVMVKSMEHIDLLDLLGVTAGKYIDKFKKSDS